MRQRQIWLLAGLLGLALVWVVLLVPFYRNGKIIAGSEGAYFLDFETLWRNYTYSWLNLGTGIFATSLSFGYVFHLAAVQAVINNEQLVNGVMIFLLYFLPTGAIYGLARQLQLTTGEALLVALFYVANPFSVNFLKSVNQWNMLAIYILPAFAWIIVRWWSSERKLFWVFGLHSLFWAFTNANPPTMILYQLTLPLIVLVVGLKKENKFIWSGWLRKYAIVVTSFVLFNGWWLANWLYIWRDAQSGYSKEFAISWLRGARVFVPEWWRSLNLMSLSQYPINPEYDALARHYSYWLAPAVLIIPLMITLAFFYQRRIAKYQLVLAVIWVVVSFLVKGVNGLGGAVYEWLVMKMPLFSLFKSAGEKWGVVLIFIWTWLLIEIIKSVRVERWKRVVVVGLIVYVGYGAVPFVEGKFLPNYRFNKLVTGSKEFIDKQEYRNLKDQLNSDTENYRVLSLPGSENYQVALRIENGRFYTGNDPVLSNTNKPFLAPYSGSWTQRFGVLYEAINHPDYLKILGLYNLKKIIINKDMYPWFGFRQKEGTEELEKWFDQRLPGQKEGSIVWYETGEGFLPRFYVPRSLVYSPKGVQSDLPDLAGFTGEESRAAYVIAPDKEGEALSFWGESLLASEADGIVVMGRIQSVIDEAKLRAGIMGLNQGGVLFPYARWRPDSWLYARVLQREEAIKKAVIDQPEKLLQQHLFFAGKRVFEIQRWNQDLKEEVFERVLRQYEQEMMGAVENLSKLGPASKKGFGWLAQTEVAFGAFNQRLLDVITEESKRKRVEEVRRSLDKKLKAVLQLYDRVRYDCLVPQDGSYEFWLTEAEGKKIMISGLGQNGEPFGLVTREGDFDQWQYLGVVNLRAGEQLFFLEEEVSENLLNDVWKMSGPERDGGSQVLNFYQGGGQTFWQEVKDWRSGNYQLSFKYQVSVGQLRVDILEKGIDVEKGKEAAMVVTVELAEDGLSEWQQYSTVVTANRKAIEAKLSFSVDSGIFGLGEAKVKDVVLTRVVEPRLALRMKKSRERKVIPRIVFQKINPTKYVLEVEKTDQPYFLVFSESFHRGWRAYLLENISPLEKAVAGSYFDGEIREVREKLTWFDGAFGETWGRRALPEERHVMVNGYANAWHITPRDIGENRKYRIIVEYWPQRLFYLGAGVTILVMLGGLVIILGKEE